MPRETVDNDVPRLTTEAEWDDYWAGVSLPAEVRRSPRSLYLNAILDVFEAHVPRAPAGSAVEVGGAPGQYLAWVHRTLGHRPTALDYSPAGCEITRRNFELLGIDGDVCEGDVFADDLGLPQFDFVYSLGLIEHFADPEPVVARQLELVKPGGTLLLGCPSFLGVNGWFIRRLAPELLETHELGTMDLDRWQSWESRLGLEVRFRGYVGGLEPCVFRARRPQAGTRRALNAAVGGLDSLVHARLRSLRRLNGKRWSGYAMAVYRKAGP